jgi:hypothetical protein
LVRIISYASIVLELELLVGRLFTPYMRDSLGHNTAVEVDHRGRNPAGPVAYSTMIETTASQNDTEHSRKHRGGA